MAALASSPVITFRLVRYVPKIGDEISQYSVDSTITVSSLRNKLRLHPSEKLIIESKKIKIKRDQDIPLLHQSVVRVYESKKFMLLIPKEERFSEKNLARSSPTASPKPSRNSSPKASRNSSPRESRNSSPTKSSRSSSPLKSSRPIKQSSSHEDLQQKGLIKHTQTFKQRSFQENLQVHFQQEVVVKTEVVFKEKPKVVSPSTPQIDTSTQTKRRGRSKLFGYDEIQKICSEENLEEVEENGDQNEKEKAKEQKKEDEPLEQSENN
jgi:hypothetical protein